MGELVDPFVEESFKEISQDERERIQADARVIEALRSRSSTHGVVNIGTVEVKFKLSISKKLRRRLRLYKNKVNDSTPTDEESDIILYDMMSSLCTEEPWTDWKTWSVYDDSAEENGAQEILVQMLQQVNAHMEDVKNFRGVK